MGESDREKLVITVAADSQVAWPNNPNCPQLDEMETDDFIDAMATEYIDSVAEGASICHLHGVRYLEDEVQEDGRKFSQMDFDGWERLHQQIADERDAIIQYGVASARVDTKIEMLDLGPDMMSYAYNAHDEYFNPRWEDEYPVNEMYGIHTREELRKYTRACMEKGVKPEVESFHTGAFFNIQELRKEGLFEDPVYTTLFLGWPGGGWTPPTPKSLINFVDHLPEETVWNVSCMDPERHWDMMAMAIMLGGHVRVGWEDCPYIDPGNLTVEGMAEANAELVEKVATLSRQLGREVATPDEAREIIGL